MSDILTSISTVITVIAILYSLWYQDIEKAIAEELPEHKDDQIEPKKRIKTTLINKAIPLFFVSFLFFIIYIPESIGIVKQSIASVQSSSWNYNSTMLAIIFINILSLLISVILIVKCIKLIKKL
ncbi:MULTISPECIES: hypothetical protein [Treponema]|uniref:Uncharacterized protein n=1 Tax=Treponema denticola OTK TaxID=999434 RepID=A0A0F6MPI5_TREDN|nr:MULTISPECIES: hypothetical protein [Treponema]EMB21557.1 hypothetical protein HMPREF9723_01330 [Treponema denticola OTK]EMB36358.1 hypothetical protein HMPREF9721_01584 [Treponema denticola ATCC 35404]EMB40692.1 hypothetical protein HMPREF9735_00250 [Treponema denticola ATCC 33521]EMB44963.1 hypothetical protein HMPREF9730_01478 [Treponema denticola AL-2]UTY27240.1 hypothetical protein E4N77_11760 [Treponema denticola]